MPRGNGQSNGPRACQSSESITAKKEAMETYLETRKRDDIIARADIQRWRKRCHLATKTVKEIICDFDLPIESEFTPEDANVQPTG